MRRTGWALMCCGVAVACGEPTRPVTLGFGPEIQFADRREVEAGFRSADGTVLSGTLILPRAPGRYAAIVMHFGSDRWTRATYHGSNLRFWIENGIAVFTYDKRGVGRSQGFCCPWQDPEYFPRLGEDVAAAARLTATHPDIAPAGVGAWGFSQGGWVVPVTAASLADSLAYVIIGSGPTVTLGEELLYSALTGDNACTPSGLTPEEIERRLDEAGPSGFDPRPYLEAMTTPGLWIYGALDTSVPVERSIQVLDDLVVRLGKDYSAVVLPRLNHTWILDGAMCQTEGPGGIDGRLIFDWLAPRLAARGVVIGGPLPQP